MLGKLLRELSGQSFPIQRVIVVDNGSSDGSVQVANQAGADVIELGRNTGFSHAVNLGIQSAGTEWIAVLNNDVSPRQDWLQNLVQQAQAANIWFAAGKLLDASDPHRLEGAFDAISVAPALGGAAMAVPIPRFGTSPARFGLPPSPRPFSAGNCSSAWGCWMRNSNPIWRILTSAFAALHAVLQEFTCPPLSLFIPVALHWGVGILPAYAKLPAINCF